VIVVSNTSPLSNLVAIGELDLLCMLYDRVYVPQAVLNELAAGVRVRPEHAQVERAQWIVPMAVRDDALVRVLRVELHPGEAEAIALALELGADLVLLDEKAGRRLARTRGLNIVGLVGSVLEAKMKSLVPSVRPILDALRSIAGFYLGDALYALALDLADETDEH